jgi:hypothetical protein
MENFYAFWDKINGEMYKDIPRPVKYDFANYMDIISNGSPLNGTEDGTWQLTPISKEETGSYAAQDVLDWFAKHGKNTTKLGPPMTDAEFKAFYGNPR